MFMFFKRKKNKNSDDSDSFRCESPDCPTPDMVHSKNESYNLDGLILCQFCYTRHLADKSVSIDYYGAKTKKIDKVEMNRITTQIPEWDLLKDSSSNLSRIGPSSSNEKYLEEVKVWNDILKDLHLESNIEKITKFSHSSKMRILQSISDYFFISFCSKDEKNLRNDENNISKIILDTKENKLTFFDSNEISKRNKDWLIENKVISSPEELETNQILVMRHTQEEIFLIEELPEKTDLIQQDVFIQELGQYFYFLNFIGCLVPFHISIIRKGEECKFMHANYEFAQSSFYDLKATIRDLYLAIPFILDQNKLEKFLEGAEKTKQKITQLIASESTVKNDILAFFSKYKIKFDSTKELPSLDAYL